MVINNLKLICDLIFPHSRNMGLHTILKKLKQKEKEVRILMLYPLLHLLHSWMLL